MTVPSSLVVIVPSPSLSKRENASLNSAICSSVSWSAMMYLWTTTHKTERTSGDFSMKFCKHIPPNVGEVDEDKAGYVESGVKISQEYNYRNVRDGGVGPRSPPSNDRGVFASVAWGVATKAQSPRQT